MTEYKCIECEKTFCWESGSVEGYSFEIKYCPYCGKELTEEDKIEKGD